MNNEESAKKCLAVKEVTVPGWGITIGGYMWACV